MKVERIGGRIYAERIRREEGASICGHTILALVGEDGRKIVFPNVCRSSLMTAHTATPTSLDITLMNLFPLSMLQSLPIHPLCYVANFYFLCC